MIHLVPNILLICRMKYRPKFTRFCSGNNNRNVLYCKMHAKTWLFAKHFFLEGSSNKHQTTNFSSSKCCEIEV